MFGQNHLLDNRLENVTHLIRKMVWGAKGAQTGEPGSFAVNLYYLATPWAKYLH